MDLQGQLRDEVEVRRCLEEENIHLTRALEEDQTELNYLNQIIVGQKQTIDALQGELESTKAGPVAHFAQLEATVQAMDRDLLTERHRRETAERAVYRLQKDCAAAASISRASVRSEDIPLQQSSSDALIPRYVSLIKEKNIEIVHLNRILKEVQKQAQANIAQMGLSGATAALLQSKEVEIDTLSSMVQDLKARLATFLPEVDTGISAASRFHSSPSPLLSQTFTTANPATASATTTTGRPSGPVLTFNHQQSTPRGMVLSVEDSLLPQIMNSLTATSSSPAPVQINWASARLKASSASSTAASSSGTSSPTRPLSSTGPSSTSRAKSPSTPGRSETKRKTSTSALSNKGGRVNQTSSGSTRSRTPTKPSGGRFVHASSAAAVSMDLKVKSPVKRSRSAGLSPMARSAAPVSTSATTESSEKENLSYAPGPATLAPSVTSVRTESVTSEVTKEVVVSRSYGLNRRALVYVPQQQPQSLSYVSSDSYIPAMYMQ